MCYMIQLRDEHAQPVLLCDCETAGEETEMTCEEAQMARDLLIDTPQLCRYSQLLRDIHI